MDAPVSDPAAQGLGQFARLWTLRQGILGIDTAVQHQGGQSLVTAPEPVTGEFENWAHQAVLLLRRARTRIFFEQFTLPVPENPQGFSNLGDDGSRRDGCSRELVEGAAVATNLPGGLGGGIQRLTGKTLYPV